MTGNVNRHEINDHKSISEDYLDPRMLVEQGDLVEQWRAKASYHPAVVELYEVGVDEERNYVARYMEGGAVPGVDDSLEFELFAHDDGDALNLAWRFTDRDEGGWEVSDYPDIGYERWTWPRFAMKTEDSILGSAVQNVPAALEYGRSLEEAREERKNELHKPVYADGPIPSFAGLNIEVIDHPNLESYDPEKFQVHKAASRQIVELFGVKEKEQDAPAAAD